MSHVALGGVIISVAAWILIVLAGVNSYIGSSGIYIIFSLVFLGLISSALVGAISYSYLFISSFLFIGLWLKMSLHAWLDRPYAEPVGFFSGFGHAWDTVLIICSVGGLGLISAKIIYHRFCSYPMDGSRSLGSFAPDVADGYPAWRLRLWMMLWGLLFLSLLANEMVGLLKLGHAPLWYLPWPLHGIYAWLMSVGFSLVIGALLWWDVHARCGNRLGLISLFVEASLVSVSTFSRGLYFLQTLPFVSVALVDRRRVLGQGWKLVGWSILWGCGLVLTVASANYARHFSNNALPINWFHQDKQQLAARPSRASMSNLLTDWIMPLGVDRWPGLEGVMAVSSYPSKGVPLLLQAATERRSANKVDFYTAQVARSSFNDEGAKIFQYATVSGPIAFFYYSGSLWFVAMGMCILSFFIMVSERFIADLTGNPIVRAVFGVYVAFLFVQITSGLSQPASSLLFTIAAIVALHYWRVLAYIKHIASYRSDTFSTT